jgi:hypothetical protein
MIRRCGCSTATTRSSGNDSSGCRYKTGARRRASTAPLSVRARAPGRLDGRRGMCARGPQAVTSSISPRPTTSRIWMALFLTESSMSNHAALNRAVLRRSNWRPHAQASSECVQSCSGSVPDQQRPKRNSSQLSVVLRFHRARPATGTPAAIYTRHAPLQNLRTVGALRRRGSVEAQSVAQNLPSSPWSVATSHRLAAFQNALRGEDKFNGTHHWHGQMVQ